MQANNTRHSKIVATLGPATDDIQVLERLIALGLDVARVNFSHGDASTVRQRVTMVRDVARRQGKFVAIMGDLQGPKIRIGRFRSGSVDLKAGATFFLDPRIAADAGDEHGVHAEYQTLAQDCSPGDVLLLDDGRMQMRVIKHEGSRVYCECLTAGKLSDKKGLNRLGGGLSAPALTEKDHEDVSIAHQLELDYIAVSFVRDVKDIEQLRSLLAEHGCKAGVVTKIERAEAVASRYAMDEIISASDAIMVARGDLGVEIGDAQLIGVQKYLIKRARELHRPVITATQMMETMVENSIPTRAEVFDVANAVLDGTDAVMLSAETAIGKHPDKVVAAMQRICLGAEQSPEALRAKSSTSQLDRVDKVIAHSAVRTAQSLSGVAALVCLSESGATPLWMSRELNSLPIYCLSSHPQTLRRVSLFRSVRPLYFEQGSSMSGNLEQIVELMRSKNLVSSGNKIIITFGSKVGEAAGTNTMKIVEV